jgi:hypothetical protein
MVQCTCHIDSSFLGEMNRPPYSNQMANAQQDFAGVILDINSSRLVWVKPDEEEAEKTHGRHPRCWSEVAIIRPPLPRPGRACMLGN